MPFTLPVYHPPDFNQPPLKDAPLVVFAPVQEPGLAPERYHATSIFPEYYHFAQGRWVLLAHSRMDGVVVRSRDEVLAVREFRHLEVGDWVALGREENGEEGIYRAHRGLYRVRAGGGEVRLSHPALPGDLLFHRLRRAL